MNKIAHLTTKAPIAVHMYSGGRFGGNLNDFLSNLVLRKELMVIIMNKVGIVCASDTELAPFLERIKNPEITEKAMLKFYSGKINGIDTVAVYSGVCKVNMAIAVQLLIEVFHVSTVINAGVAGGIDENIKPFDTVISEQTAYHDVSEDILTDFHPWMRSVYFQADKNLLDAAREYSRTSKHSILFGTIVTGGQFIEDEKRERIKKQFSPLAVDMETAAAAHVCYVNNIPFISVRTITDAADEDGMENFEKNCETASEMSAEITIGLVNKL